MARANKTCLCDIYACNIHTHIHMLVHKQIHLIKLNLVNVKLDKPLKAKTNIFSSTNITYNTPRGLQLITILQRVF